MSQIINDAYSFEPIEYRLNQMPDHPAMICQTTPYNLTQKRKAKAGYKKNSKNPTYRLIALFWPFACTRVWLPVISNSTITIFYFLLMP